MIKTTQYNMVDFCKFFFSFLVIAIHTHAGILENIGRLAVPFFFIISSYFFFKKYLFSNNKKIILKKYLLRLVYLFLSWQILYIPLMYQSIHDELIHSFSIKAIVIIFIKFIIFGFNDGWFPSWYLFASFYGMIFVIFLRKFIKDWIILLLGIGLEIIIFFKLYIINISIPIDLSFFRAIFFIMIGLFLAKYPSILYYFKKHNAIINCLSLMSIIFYILMSYTHMFIYFTNIVAIIITLWTLSTNIKLKYSKFFRQSSTFIYCSHIFFITYIFNNLNIQLSLYKPIEGYLELIITFILCLITYYIVNKLRTRLPNNHWLLNLY